MWLSKGPPELAQEITFTSSRRWGGDPDLKYRDEPTELHIGDDNVIRET